MTNLIGNYTHKLDEKGRVSLPSKIRSLIGEVVIVTRGLDGCLYVYSELSWALITAELRNLSLTNSASRAFNRHILAFANEVIIDKAGRILLPENLRKYLNLTSEVVIAGVGNRLELWTPESWQAQQTSLDSNIDELAETLSSIGML